MARKSRTKFRSLLNDGLGVFMFIKIGNEPAHERLWLHDGIIYDLRIEAGNGSAYSTSASEKFIETPNIEVTSRPLTGDD